MIIRLTEEKDIKEVVRVYQKAKEYMKASGNPNQWNGEYPGEIDVIEDIKKRQGYVVLEDDKICGCFAFILGKDKTYGYIEDGKWLDDELPYGTIHRIASDGSVKGIFKEVTDFCFGIINNVRIDTHHDNKTMQHLSEKHGFTKCGIIYIESGDQRIAYQKIVK